MLALILESLGGTELIFILVIALIFFGPRKLPQLSRSIGRSLAEFRRASEDFKRTWEREVDLESARTQDGGEPSEDLSMLPEPTISPIPAEQVIARDSPSGREPSSEPPENSYPTSDPASAEPLTKRDWL